MENERPDLLLTDIRMPQMDGLELIEMARLRGYGFRSIILSGYNEFSYAKCAISLGVVDYAKLVGYGEERYFSATFKKWTGLTPSQYQKGLEK